MCLESSLPSYSGFTLECSAKVSIEMISSEVYPYLTFGNRLENLDALVPEPAISPIQLVSMRGRIRQRASSRTREPPPPADWSWGDEP